MTRTGAGPCARRGAAADLCRALLLALLATAASANGTPDVAPPYPPFGLDMTALDRSTRPGDDFFQYANGGWLARTPIPPDKPSVTEAQGTRNRVEARLHDLFEAAAAQQEHEPAGMAAKVGAMYRAFLDTKRRDALAEIPIGRQLVAIRAARSHEALAALMGRSVEDLESSFFQVSIDVDLKDTNRYVVYLSQAGLTMPDRDYYLEAGLEAKRTQFRHYVESLLKLETWPSPHENAAAILALETRIASVSWTKAQQREVEKMYNPMTRAHLKAFAPGMAWDELLKSAHLANITGVVVNERGAFPEIARIFSGTPVETLQAWLAFSVGDAAAQYLSQPFAQAYFDFHRRSLLGTKERSAPWKEAIRAISGGDCGTEARDCFGTLNWAVGQMYAERYFPAEAKTRVEEMVHDLIQAYRARIEKLDWMSDATRKQALHKLDTYVVKVGYPDHPRDYSHVVIRDDDLVGDVERAAVADWAFYLGRMSGPVDKSDWTMTPQTVDAYNGNLRDIVFPAAILSPPEFDAGADPAVNFGAAGTLIGHELTHGFDDMGRKLDAAGALRNWWTTEDDREFRQRAAVLGGQYAQYEPVPGTHIKADQTMGENLADLGGVVIALDAYHASLHGAPAAILAGLSGDQRFFRSYAQAWRGKSTPDYIRDLTISDPHSYRSFRVNGIVRNVDAWYQAFDVRPGDKLYLDPARRARVW